MKPFSNFSISLPLVKICVRGCIATAVVAMVVGISVAAETTAGTATIPTSECITVPLPTTATDSGINTENISSLKGHIDHPAAKPNSDGKAPAVHMVPEPATLALFGCGGLGLLIFAWLQRKEMS
jgi:hypothetical protein